MMMEPVGVRRYERAFVTLGLEPTASQLDIKRAYRRAVAAHPPDRDPDGFVSVRESFELLCHPEKALDELLVTLPCTQEPVLLPPPEVELRRALPLAALRDMVASLDSAALLGDEPPGDRER